MGCFNKGENILGVNKVSLWIACLLPQLHPGIETWVVRLPSTLLAIKPTGKKGGNGEKRDKETELEEDNIEREGGEYELFVDMNLVWENLLLLKREKVV